MFYDKGVWIYLDEVSRGEKPQYGAPAAYFRKEFKTEKRVKRAVWYVSALGVFKAYVNGSEADDDFLSPGLDDYREYVTEKATVEELKAQNSYFINALYREDDAA